MSLLVSVAVTAAGGWLVYRMLRSIYPVVAVDHWKTYAGLLGLLALACLVSVVFAIIGLIKRGSRLLALLAIVLMVVGVPWSVNHAFATGVDYLKHELAIVASQGGEQLVSALSARGVTLPGWVDTLLTWLS